MDYFTFFFLLSILYAILGIWGVVEAVLLRQHWAVLCFLMVLLIVTPAIGFGLTLFFKYWLRRKKSGPKKKKEKKKKKGADETDPDPNLDPNSHPDRDEKVVNEDESVPPSAN